VSPGEQYFSLESKITLRVPEKVGRGDAVRQTFLPGCVASDCYFWQSANYTA